jgi:hypothetical protein
MCVSLCSINASVSLSLVRILPPFLWNFVLRTRTLVLRVAVYENTRARSVGRKCATHWLRVCVFSARHFWTARAFNCNTQIGHLMVSIVFCTHAHPPTSLIHWASFLICLHNQILSCIAWFVLHFKYASLFLLRHECVNNSTTAYFYHSYWRYFVRAYSTFTFNKEQICYALVTLFLIKMFSSICTMFKCFCTILLLRLLYWMQLEQKLTTQFHCIT